MSLDHGGHLTHGSKVNFSGKIYESYSYGIDPETGDIDYAQVESLSKRTQAQINHLWFFSFLRYSWIGQDLKKLLILLVLFY